MNFNCLTYFKAVVLIVIKNTVKSAVDTDIVRTKVFISSVNCVCSFKTVCRTITVRLGIALVIARSVIAWCVEPA